VEAEDGWAVMESTEPRGGRVLVVDDDLDDAMLLRLRSNWRDTVSRPRLTVLWH
jgi:hypothetical protein